MTDTLEGAPSKRAMDIAWRVLDILADIYGDCHCDRQEVARILDAEFRKGEALAEAVEAYLHGDYPRAPKNGQCKHGSWSWHGCEACTDEFLEPALAAYRAAEPA